MKSIVEKINESLRGVIDDSLYKESDMLTREYNNVFGMMSDTLMSLLPCGCCHAIAGSKIREGYDWIFSKDIAVNGMTVSDWAESRGLCLMSNGGECLVGDCSDPEVIEHALAEASEYFDDKDYIIVL